MSFSWGTLPFVAAFFALFFLARKRRENSYLLFSSLSLYQKQKRTKKNGWNRLIRTCWIGAVLLLGLALLNPHGSKKLIPRGSEEGVALYLALDRSSSMRARLPELKKLAKSFVDQREGDWVGLIGFARVPEVYSPLTQEKEALQKKIADLVVVENKEEDGTAIGYAIYKGAQLIAATKEFSAEQKLPYELRESALVLLTDGFQYPHPEDRHNRIRAMGLPDAAKEASEASVKLYLISLNPDIEEEKYAPYRRLMEKAAASTGGRYFIATDQKALSSVFGEIDALQKALLPPKEPRHFVPSWFLYPYLIGAGALLFFAAFALELLFVRRGP